VNLQEAFNKIWERAKDKTKAQEVVCMDGLMTTDCMFRTADGKKCFIGVLSPDEKYAPWMDWRGPRPLQYAAIASLRAVLREIGMCVDEGEYRALLDVQYIHDTTPPEHWEERLRTYARNNHLTIPEENTNAAV
jgi:hypothetical protein